MSTQLLKRQFIFKKNDSTITLDDINSDLPCETIKEIYSAQFPELLNASIVDKGFENGHLVYEFETIAGTKG